MTESTTQVFDWSSLYEGNEKELSTPILLTSDVIHGFKRGSKELGIPTANMNMEVLGDAGDSLSTGIYYGIAHLEDQRYQTVVSVGWNPYYKNEKKTIEAHLLASLEDFYGKQLTLELFGYLRAEANFKSLGKSNPFGYPDFP